MEDPRRICGPHKSEHFVAGFGFPLGHAVRNANPSRPVVCYRGLGREALLAAAPCDNARTAASILLRAQVQFHRSFVTLITRMCIFSVRWTCIKVLRGTIRKVGDESLS